ncbi:hypothetical protein FKM82_026760 [Ascaphus truei]
MAHNSLNDVNVWLWSGSKTSLVPRGGWETEETSTTSPLEVKNFLRHNLRMKHCKSIMALKSLKLLSGAKFNPLLRRDNCPGVSVLPEIFITLFISDFRNISFFS